MSLPQPLELLFQVTNFNLKEVSKIYLSLTEKNYPNLEDQVILSEVLYIFGTEMIEQKEIEIAASALWNARLLDLENVECSRLFQDIGYWPDLGNYHDFFEVFIAWMEKNNL